mmetsp:Transcript_103909/g.318287  ORF Transcript_103909/g.318287 Transcript_103909/m.318287 type:complete len:299 (-) Transcript_103909:757-1653(-)
MSLHLHLIYELLLPTSHVALPKSMLLLLIAVLAHDFKLRRIILDKLTYDAVYIFGLANLGHLLVRRACAGYLWRGVSHETVQQALGVVNPHRVEEAASIREALDLSERHHQDVQRGQFDDTANSTSRDVNRPRRLKLAKHKVANRRRGDDCGGLVEETAFVFAAQCTRHTMPCKGSVATGVQTPQRKRVLRRAKKRPSKCHRRLIKVEGESIPRHRIRLFCVLLSPQIEGGAIRISKLKRMVGTVPSWRRPDAGQARSNITRITAINLREKHWICRCVIWPHGSPKILSSRGLRLLGA